MRLIKSLALSLLFSTPLAQTGLAQSETSSGAGRSIIVLDASGSMWGQIDGRAKLEIARDALGAVLSGIPAETELGLMAYGHRSKGDCGDIELVVPPGKGTAGAITSAARDMKFLGKTPLTAAVRQAAAELKSTEEKATVILITDGIETCEADPCALGTELEASGVDFTAHVVGFGLTKEEGQAVACLAQNTGGQYIEAKNASQLEEALKTTVQAEPAPPPPPPPPVEPAVLEHNLFVTVVLAEGQAPIPETDQAMVRLFKYDESGAPARDADYISARKETKRAAGRYKLQVEAGAVKLEQDIELSDTERLAPVVVLNAGVLRLRGLAYEGGEPDNNLSLKLKGPNDISEIGYARLKTIVPAGSYRIEAALGSAAMEVPIEVKAGDDISQDIVMGTGIGRVTVVYAGDLLVKDNDLKVQIFPSTKSIDGSREEVGYGWGNEKSFDLSPGDYIAFASLDAATMEAPLSIKVKELTDVKIDLQAGVVAIVSPHDERIDILSPKKDIEGNQATILGNYGPQWQAVLPAGDYIARIKLDGAIVDTPFKVTAGERLDLSLAGATAE